MADAAAGYFSEVLPGLEESLALPSAAMSWMPGDTPRWWVRPASSRKAGANTMHALMFGEKQVRRTKDIFAFHQLVREADYLNARSLTPENLTGTNTEP